MRIGKICQSTARRIGWGVNILMNRAKSSAVGLRIYMVRKHKFRCKLMGDADVPHYIEILT